MQTEVLDEFLFADVIAKSAPTEEKMQKDVDQVFDSCDNYLIHVTSIISQSASKRLR